MSKSKYRIYPLLLLGFFRVANIGMINLTIPIFFFQLGYSPGLIGIISASLNFVYIFSPLLFKNLPDRIGNKASLVICLGAITFFQLFYQFTNNPYIFILLRLLEGLMLGLFWPVLNSSLSILTSIEKSKEGSKQENIMGSKLIRKYSLSWNLGSVASFLIGSFLLFFVANINLMFNISFIYIVICLILALLFQEPKKNDYSNQDMSIPTQSKIEIKKPKYIYYSIFLPLFIILMYGFLEHSNGLIYPLKYEILKIPLFINYLSSFILITSQTIFTYKGMSISLGKLKKVTIVSIGALSMVLFIASFNSNIFIFFLLFGVFGTSLAFLYCFSFKLIILKNILENTSKYGFYFESSISLSFFLGTFIGGLISDLGLNFAYLMLSIVAFIGLLSYLIFQTNVHLKLNNKNIET